MKLLAPQLQGYTANQSSTIGWKSISCAKNIAANSVTGCLRITIASGNPLFYFTVFQEEWVTESNGAGQKYIGWTKGYRIQTSGAIDNPTGNGACNFIPFQLSANDGNINWAYETVGTRTITWNTTNSGVATSTIHFVTVFSERIDLITLSCL